jgi:S1-C subfamily serine protease
MERNGEIRNKRKQSPSTSFDRPAKQLKPNLAALFDQDGIETPQEDPFGMESDGDEGRLLPVATTTVDSAEWQQTIEMVVRNVVSIHFCQTCSFDTDAACSSEATGFVVDAEKGYILTNRHVVSSGPFVGYCIFDNHEEVRVFNSSWYNMLILSIV